jgi:hypothetical protein
MYAITYNEFVFKLLEEQVGKGQAVLFARTSAAGGQRLAGERSQGSGF